MSPVISNMLKFFQRNTSRIFLSTSTSFRAREMTVREALNSALDEEINNDKNVFILGEEVALYDGAYKITKGLHNKYGDERIVDTPITEMGFAGLAVGAALGGLKPICEFMTFNFALQAMDHIINSAAKGLYMSGGLLKCPIVFRGPNGSPGAVGAQHSQCFSSWFMNIPGLVVLYPYDCEDARGLLKAAVRDPNPVIFLESEALYSKSFMVSDEALSTDFVLPIGKAKIAREGKSLTIVAFERGVGISLEAAEELKQKYGVECEVINLRSLRPFDIDTIVESVKKTNNLVTVENGWHTCGVGSEISAAISESSSFYNLDSPIIRVTGADVPTPYAFNLESLAFPNSQDVVKAVKKALSI